MFDWPEPSHTSPTRTSFTMIGVSPAFLPAMVISNGPPGFNFPRRTVHFPVASAVADLVWPLNLMVPFAAGSAVPHIGTGIPLCSTMWSLKSVEGSTSAEANVAKQSMTQRDATMERGGANLIRILDSALGNEANPIGKLFAERR